MLGLICSGAMNKVVSSAVYTCLLSNITFSTQTSSFQICALLIRIDMLPYLPINFSAQFHVLQSTQ